MSIFDKIGNPKSTSALSQPVEVPRMDSESSEFVDCVYGCSETYLTDASESKLIEEDAVLVNWSLDTELDRYKKEDIFSDVVENKSVDSDCLEMNCNTLDDDCKETNGHRKKTGTDEDSQLEYHSAEEQDYSDHSLPFDKLKTLAPNPQIMQIERLHDETKFTEDTDEKMHTTNLETSRISVRNNQLIEEDREITSSTINESNFMCTDLKIPSPFKNAATHFSVNQVVDVCSDFRACFMTSRATSAGLPVVSRSSNTVITLMNRKWPNEICKSVACNTDLPYKYKPREEMDSKMALNKALEKHFVDDIAKANGNVLIKDSQELKEKLDVKEKVVKNSGRIIQHSEEVEDNFPSKCCQNTFQRAVNAELNLLKIYYYLCHQHCWKIYEYVKEERKFCDSDFDKTELDFAFLSDFEDLKAKYMRMREKVIGGVPLDELPPLSTESKLKPFFSSFVPSKLLKEECHIFPGEKSNLDFQGGNNAGISTGLKRTPSKMPSFPENCSSNSNSSSKDVGVVNLNLKRDIKPFDNTVYIKSQEIPEDWFDAKENLTVVDFSEVCGTEVEQVQLRAAHKTEMTALESSEKEPKQKYFLHVGGLGPSVSQADLMTHFQKYQTSEVFIYNSGNNYRYATLSFKKAKDAKMAVQEMNGKTINGKSVNVRFTKTSTENVSPLVHKLPKKNIDTRMPSLETTSSFKESSSMLETLGSGPEPKKNFILVNQKVAGKDLKQVKSQVFPLTTGMFMPPNNLNLSSFTKLIKKLEELHPKSSRDSIINALQEVRTKKGFLNGLPINTIVEMTSLVLKDRASKHE
ncbi:RNA-binding protein 44 isoform X1 [Ornithorhynchus anatinus]|uniref:RNA binding motif protein 44 n=1 Tax=Ornithorhynchus anatinus TaxID=9258 RepID=F6RBG9_ORNAN|nr:RNA-binding protein 44 isoform X1 [Ornithorhynchus anatinus]